MVGHDLEHHFDSMTQWNGFGANIGPLAQAAPLAGFFNSLTYPDGVVRRLPLVARYSDNYYESLALAMFRRFVGMPQVTFGRVPSGINSAKRPALQSIVLKWPDKTFSIPVDERGAMWVPFRGFGGVHGGSFKYLSASDVLTGKVPGQQLKGKIVLVGTTAFGTYVPPESVQEMIKDPDRYTMRAKSDELTVMFCDMRGFTRMSEQMDPVQLQQLLNQVLSELTQLIGANLGTVDKYMGDCVMAFWGAPVASPAHAQLAVKTALQMTQALGRINQAHKAGALAHVDIDIGLGIGINTGQMYVGDMGANIRRSYTVIGDAVNLGSRLEGLSKVYGVSIVASQATQALATDYVWQELDRVRVKGKQQAVTILTPVALATAITSAQSEELVLWHTFLVAYRAQNRAQCDLLLGQLLQLDASRPLYKLYAERIAATRDLPIDPGWDAITYFETK